MEDIQHRQLNLRQNYSLVDWMTGLIKELLLLQFLGKSFIDANNLGMGFHGPFSWFLDADLHKLNDVFYFQIMELKAA